jgi:hypothetical protein
MPRRRRCWLTFASAACIVAFRVMGSEFHGGQVRVTRPGPHTQDLRVAVAMTGGASLAVWIGGVARELNLLQQAGWLRDAEALDDRGGVAGSDDGVRMRYLRLISLLDVTVGIDVMSGTGGGGINAAVLGMARACPCDLGGLRDMWLEAGAFDTLLRDPAGHGPPSLLHGDVALREHNDRVDSLRVTRLRMADFGVRLRQAARSRRESSAACLVTPQVMDDYCHRQARFVARPVIDALVRVLHTMPADQIPASFRDAFSPGRSAERDCQEAAAAAIGHSWRSCTYSRAGLSARPAVAEPSRAVELQPLRPRILSQTRRLADTSTGTGS